MKSKTMKKAAALQQFFARNPRTKFPQSTGESILSALQIVVKTADITEEDHGGVSYIKGNIGAKHQTKASLLERISELENEVKKERTVTGLLGDLCLRGVSTCLDRKQVPQTNVQELEDVLDAILRDIVHEADGTLLDQL
jgi:Mg2+ and Co2+ transporter CorA